MKYLKVAVIIICLCVLFAACKKECLHQYQSEITLQATCTQAGEEVFTCTLCKHSYTQPVSVQEHAYEPGEIEKEATCAEEGLQKYSCTACGASKSEPIEKLPHVLENATVTKEPNCTQEGEHCGTCTVCGAEQVTEKLATNGIHVFTSSVVREATCTEPGEGINTCSLCQHTEPCQYEQKAHSYGKETVLTKATCTEKGLKELACTQCGHTVKETISAAGHKWNGASCVKAGICSVCKATGSKTNHTYVTISDKAYSEMFAGQRTKKCKTCGNQKEEYYSASYVYDLDAIGAEIAEYAKKRGLQVSLHEVDEPDYKYSDSVWELERFSWGPDRLIEGGKGCIDAAYNNYAGTPAGIGAYTAHIYVYYTQSGAIGSGFFGVYIDITS